MVRVRYNPLEYTFSAVPIRIERDSVDSWVKAKKKITWTLFPWRMLLYQKQSNILNARSLYIKEKWVPSCDILYKCTISFKYLYIILRVCRRLHKVLWLRDERTPPYTLPNTLLLDSEWTEERIGYHKLCFLFCASSTRFRPGTCA